MKDKDKNESEDTGCSSTLKGLTQTGGDQLSSTEKIKEQRGTDGTSTTPCFW